MTHAHTPQCPSYSLPNPFCYPSASRFSSSWATASSRDFRNECRNGSLAKANPSRILASNLDRPDKQFRPPAFRFDPPPSGLEGAGDAVPALDSIGGRAFERPVLASSPPLSAVATGHARLDERVAVRNPPIPGEGMRGLHQASLPPSPGNAWESECSTDSACLSIATCLRIMDTRRRSRFSALGAGLQLIATTRSWVEALRDPRGLSRLFRLFFYSISLGHIGESSGR